MLRRRVETSATDRGRARKTSGKARRRAMSGETWRGGATQPMAFAAGRIPAVVSTRCLITDDGELDTVGVGQGGVTISVGQQGRTEGDQSLDLRSDVRCSEIEALAVPARRRSRGPPVPGDLRAACGRLDRELVTLIPHGRPPKRVAPESAHPS